jgi:hypothetical protein
MREYILTQNERVALRHYLETGDKTPELRVLETRIRDNLTSGRLPEDYKFIQRWVYAYCEGKARRFVTYGSESGQKVAKTLITMIRKESITPSELREILNNVRNKTVLGCSDQQLASDRSKRFSELKQLSEIELK